MLCGGNTVIMCSRCDTGRKSFFCKTHFFSYPPPPTEGHTRKKKYPTRYQNFFLPPPPWVHHPLWSVLFLAQYSPCIRGLFAVVYRIAKRDGVLNDLPGDAELVTLTGGSITPSYHGQTASVTILHAIAAPYRADEGAAIMASQFFGLASDLCTDRGARKEELLYTHTVRNGLVTTSYLGCEYLKSGDAGAIVASYKRALLRAGAPVEEWVARLFWYSADGADVMQGANTGVFGRLRSLQTELLGFNVVVPFHANCHRADLAFRDAMAAGNYGFLDIVADGMQAIALHWNLAPARLGVLRTMCDALRTTLLKFGVLRQRRWAAFAAKALRSLIRTYPAMVCALFALCPRPAVKRRKTDPQLISDSEELGGEAYFCLGQEHDSAQVREREGSEWPLNF